ncbi:hypothetical protein NPS70_28105 [Streptomyces sp. C10-9-1]|uniref:hypothetical protein n=1 Tax=Streptomyces sp. C10-9-1 TaxID=1859285 RepID=UPI002111D702|nr:hypothetical protein [Streptomyces sp. C10-9-1]MCQ6557020.1 hypothetical protein [Streptomyces sp. C10-9-1]
MSLLTTLLRLQAADTEQAQDASTIRHFHLAERPLIFLPLNRAGTEATPLAFMYGDDQAHPNLLIAPPRGRPTALLNDLADGILTYIDSFPGTERLPARGTKAARHRRTHAPQLLVANRKSLHYIDRLGRALRFTDTPETADPDRSVGRLGQWLTFFAEHAEHPGSALLLALTDLLTTHWVTGQSPLEDEHLATLLAWINPPPGTTGLHAALAAEAPHRQPAGPATDPSFDTIELDPLLTAFDTAAEEGNTAAMTRHTQRLHDLLRTYLTPAWDDAWNALGLLRSLPQTPDAHRRWDTDRDRFTAFSTYLADDGRPQPIKDDAVSAARRLARLEQAAGAFEARRALEDPFVMAERRTTGEALAGTVIDTDPDRTITGPTGRLQLWPRFTLHTTDPVRLDVGHLLASPHNPRVHLAIRDITPRDGGTDLLLEVTTQKGTVAKPNRTSVPAVGDILQLTLAPEFFRQPPFPSRDNTTWTHGGPQHDHPIALDEAEEPQR